MLYIEGTVSGRVQAQLKAARITGRELADELGWTHDKARRRIRGEVPFTADELAAVARFLKVPISRFYEDLGG